MVLICKVFIIENLTVRFAIPAISVIFKNSAAVTNTHSGWLGIKLIPACRFPFICCMVFALNQSNHIGIGLTETRVDIHRNTIK